MNRKFTRLLTLLMVFAAHIVVAQQITITGRVTDDTGSALPGVSILIKGTNDGTHSDAEGRYVVSTRVGAELVFSFIGMKTVERVISANSNVLNISLETDATFLNEVLIVAYGDQEKKAIVGSVASLDSKTLEKQQITNVGQALQGTVCLVLK